MKLKQKSKKSPHPAWALKHRGPGMELRNINGRYYLYAVSSVYDPELKRPKKITGKILGKITKEDGFIESDKGKLRQSAQKGFDAATLSIKEYGFTSFLHSQCDELNVSLQKHFPQHWQAIMILAYNRLVHHSCIKNMPFNYSKSFLSEMYPMALSDKIISGLLRQLGQNREQLTGYMQSFIRPNDYVLVDMTNLFSSSTHIAIAKEGYNSDLIFDKQFNILYIYSPSLKLPVFYRLYAGNVREVKGFKLCLKESAIENAVVVCDKGFYSKSNLELLEDNGLKYIMPLRRDNLLIEYNRLGKQGRNYFKHEGRYIWHCDYIKDKKNVFLFMDDNLKLLEEKDYLNRIESHPEEYTIENFHKFKDRFGTMAVITNTEESDPQKMYSTYKSRNSIEIMFDGMKNILDNDKTYMQNEDALNGWMFINHIALQWYYKLYSQLNESNQIKKYSVNDLIIQLRDIRKARINGQWHLEPITAGTEKILGKVGIHIT